MVVILVLTFFSELYIYISQLRVKGKMKMTPWFTRPNDIDIYDFLLPDKYSGVLEKCPGSSKLYNGSKNINNNSDCISLKEESHIYL